MSTKSYANSKENKCVNMDYLETCKLLFAILEKPQAILVSHCCF